MIARDREGNRRASAGEWHSASRQEPLWRAHAGKHLLQRVNAQGGQGRFFDEAGKLRAGAEELFHAVGGSDLFKVAAPVADREESDRPFEENVWIRSGIKAISEGFVRLMFELYPSAPDTGVEPLTSNPLLDVLASPNKVMTPSQFWRAHAINYKHDGEVVWFMMDEQGQPVDANAETRILSQMPVTILPVRGNLVEIQYDDGGMPYLYRYTTSFSRNSSRVSPAFPCGSVVHFRDYDPYNFARGLGDVESLERETDLYFQAFRAMDASVRNGGDPGGFIIYDHEVDGAEMARRQEMADDEFSGPNQRRIKLLQSSAKFVPNPVKPSDMQYETLLTWLRDSILSGLGVPPPVVGVYDNATYNNIETAHRELWTGPNGILSLASSTADVITNDLLPRMIRLGTPPGTVAHFNSSMIEALQQEVGDQLMRAAEIAAKGIGVSYNEVLEQQGTEVSQPQEGDRRFITPSLVDIDAVGDEPAAPSEDDDVQASRTTLAPDKDRVDEVYKAWRGVVNMSASSLEAWGETECSRKASVNPSAVIKRNLNLMRKKKSEWGAKEVRDANRAVSFISRMKGMPKGKPIGDCPSKRDISLKNWGFNPGRSSNSYESNGGDTCCGQGQMGVTSGMGGEVELAEGTSADVAVALARRDGELPYDEELHALVVGWITKYENAQLAKLRRIAGGSFRRLSIFDENINLEAMPLEAWSAILLNHDKWAMQLDETVRKQITVIFGQAAAEAAAEVGGGIISTQSPEAIRTIATQLIQLSEGVTSTLARQVRNSIANVFVKNAPPGNLRMVIQELLPELTEDLKKVFGTKEARAATIAQTETGNAVNGGKWTQYEASNVEEIQWVASQDRVTRPSHLSNDGMVRKMGQMFPNGLRYPHDPQGRASEVINCRCAFQAVKRRDPLDDPDLVIE